MKVATGAPRSPQQMDGREDFRIAAPYVDNSYMHGDWDSVPAYGTRRFSQRNLTFFFGGSSTSSVSKSVVVGVAREPSKVVTLFFIFSLFFNQSIVTFVASRRGVRSKAGSKQGVYAPPQRPPTRFPPISRDTGTTVAAAHTLC